MSTRKPLKKLLSNFSDITAKNLTRSTATSVAPLAGKHKNLKQYLRFAELKDLRPSPSLPKPSQSISQPLSEIAVQSNRNDDDEASVSVSESKREMIAKIGDILNGSDSEDDFFDSDNEPPELMDQPWLQPPTISPETSSRRKIVTTDRKQRSIFSSEQGTRTTILVKMCANKLGTDETMQVFGKLSRETGVKEFNAIIETIIEKARETDDEMIALKEFRKAYGVFELMRERGLEIGEITYGPFLHFIIHMCMVEEFFFFCDLIKKENPNCVPRLAYYEMCLWIRVGDEDKIRLLLEDACGNDESNFNDSYLVALCEGDRQDEVAMLLERIDIKKFSSNESLERVFISLGRHLLESHAKKFILELKTLDDEKDLLNLIYVYTKSIPNIQIENMVAKFKSLKDELKITSSSKPKSFEELIKNCCDSLEVQLAMDLVDLMFEDGQTVKPKVVNNILTTCYESCEFNLVYRIKSMIDDHDIKQNAETIRSLISLYIKMKDFDGAYDLIKDLKRLNISPTANMYNTIMGGYFRQKNFEKGLMVLKQMDASDVKPDSLTYSYIIGNCSSEDDIIKYRRELDEAVAYPTKHIFMALINAYAACGLFEKAKQVLLDKKLPQSNLNEIKSALVSALACNNQITDALKVYDEINQNSANVEPKAILALIEHLESEGELSRLLQMLNQLQESNYWDDACARSILYCVRHKLLSSAVDLLKQRMEKSTNEMVTEVLLDEVFYEVAEMEPTDVQFGLDLLQGIKKDLGIRASRRSLDFLFSACVKAKDLKSSYQVWEEYEIADLPYNVFTFLWMYQALLASGDHKAAKHLLQNIHDHDPHVRRVLHASLITFGENEKKTKTKKKKK